MPDDRADALGLGRHVVREEWGDEYARVGVAAGVAPVAADDAEDPGSPIPREIDGTDDVGGDAALEVTAANREDEEGVGRVQAGDPQPLDEGRVPALVVDPGGQLADVVGRRVGLDAADLAEVVDGMARVAGRAAD